MKLQNIQLWIKEINSMADIYLKCDHLVVGEHDSQAGRFPNKFDADT
jgi:hypothetical protein